MTHRRNINNRSGCQSRLIAGLLIVAGAILIFNAYGEMQTLLNAPPPTATRLIVSVAAQPTEGRGGLRGTPAPPSQLWIEAEKAQLNAQITTLYYGENNTWNVTFLGMYAGHLQGTPELGSGGNYVLAGHVEMRDGSPGPFANLSRLARGDRVTISRSTPSSIQYVQYIVTETKVVNPNEVDVLNSRGYEELTLITCGNYDFKENVYKTRIVVHARPVKDVPELAVPNSPH
jgi:LPXTG-site transpeptidase (sortase) family protein